MLIISVSFGGTTLLSDVTFSINENDKIALMGKNGACKSTILKFIAGEAKPTTGNVTGPKEAVIAYLPQHLLTQDKVTVLEETMKAFAEANQMQKELDELNEQLTIRTDYDSDDYLKFIKRVSNIVGKHVRLSEFSLVQRTQPFIEPIGRPIAYS